MPYIITEPQRVAGTKIGFAVYPYQFSFFDRTKESEFFKLVIVKLKDSSLVEVEKIISQQRYHKDHLSNEIINTDLKAVLKCNPNYVVNIEKMNAFFEKSRTL